MSLGPLMIDLLGTAVTPEEHELMRHPLVGGVILFTRNYVDPEQLTQLVAGIHAERSPPLIVAVDQEGGRVQRFRQGSQSFPRPGGSATSSTWTAGQAWSSRGAWGGSWRPSCVPWVSTSRSLPCRPRLRDQRDHRRPGFPRAPDGGGQLAAAYMHGMRDAGMAATAKHFPAHGAVVADSHLTLPVDRRELPDLADDLAPYRRLIANGLPAVMVAHVLFPAVDSVPASLSSRWIRDVLRGDLRFQGVVFADDLSMGGAAAAYGDIVTRARKALSAGCDMLPVCNNRAGVVTLLDRLDVEPEPASRLRLVRMHGKDGVSRRELTALPEWKRSRELLARCTAAPTLNLEAGRT